MAHWDLLRQRIWQTCMGHDPKMTERRDALLQTWDGRVAMYISRILCYTGDMGGYVWQIWDVPMQAGMPEIVQITWEVHNTTGQARTSPELEQERVSDNAQFMLHS